MIVATLLRNYKTYNKNVLIPISVNDKFCALIGENGIGKSSVLEALNSFFKNRNWELNVGTRKNKNLEALIVPLFLVPKDKVPEKHQSIFDRLSDYYWDVEGKNFNSANRKVADQYLTLRDRVSGNYARNDFFLIAIGINYAKDISLGIFNNKEFSLRFKEEIQECKSQEKPDLDFLSDHLNWIKTFYHYIYIPKDINPEDFVKIENEEIQELMGESLKDIINKAVTGKDLRQINTRLNSFMNQIKEELKIYEFRTSANMQRNLNKADINKLIVQAFFSSRKLYKKESEFWIKMDSLSSGEKQKAIIEVAHTLITKHRDKSDNLVIAIDEPESSLHMSACFDQFKKLHELSRSINQLIITSHWYGFLPMIESGSICSITKNELDHQFDNLDVTNYREEIKHRSAYSKGILPFDVRLKSINDFIQTIVISLIDKVNYNWIICEGSSEKVYFEYLFSKLLPIPNLNIVPVGGAAEVKRIYQSYEVSISDFRKELHGKILFLTDTDSHLVEYETKNLKNTKTARYVNVETETILVSPASNPKSPPTDIEKILHGQVYVETLDYFKKDHDELSFISASLSSEKELLNSYYCLDLRTSESQLLDHFFAKKGIKYEFSKKYVEIANLKKHSNLKPLNWMKEVHSFFTV